MAIHCLYEDFFAFLKALDPDEEDSWELYQKLYFRPHRDFFGAYWKTFFPQMDLRALQGRVRKVRPGHYAALEHLVKQRKPGTIVAEVLPRCLALLPRFPEPDVYLMVGFFSADGFIVEVEGWPAIGIGLERFKDFRLLDVILAHEYCHYARRLALGSLPAPDQQTLGQKLLSEGLSVAFSRSVFPQRRLEDLLLMSRRRLNWCQQNEALLESTAREDMNSSCLVPLFFGSGKHGEDIPPRTGMYLGYRLVEQVLEEMGERGFEGLLGVADIISVLFADEQLNRDG
jgi:hypothetical protein